jgi:hypothetical protein
MVMGVFVFQIPRKLLWRGIGATRFSPFPQTKSHFAIASEPHGHPKPMKLRSFSTSSLALVSHIALWVTAGERDENGETKGGRNGSSWAGSFAPLSPVPPAVEHYPFAGGEVGRHRRGRRRQR